MSHRASPSADAGLIAVANGGSGDLMFFGSSDERVRPRTIPKR